MHWLVSHGVDARRLETLGLGTVSTKSGPSTAQGASFVVEFRILEREAPAVLP
jgi:hypothetical protein